MPRLTKRFVDLMQADEKERVIFDDDLPGFGVRVKTTGVKSYIIQYRQNGKSRRMTLGRHGVLTADAARKLAKVRLGDVAHGDDPAVERRAERQAPTVADLAADYLERHAIPNKRKASVYNDRRMLDRLILPALGSAKVKDVSRRGVETLLLDLKATPYQANRVRALLSKMFSLAVAWEWRTNNPVDGIAKFQETKRERWLSEDELKRLFSILAGHPNQRAANVIRLLVLTGARKSEVMGATWDQFDLERGMWTKPSHLTKQKRTEHIPLSDSALAILRNMRTQAPADGEFVFPGDTPGKPLQCIKKFWEEVCLAANIHNARVHDLRHTFASHLVSGGVSLPIVGRLLGHTQPQTTQRYAHLADNPLREAANRFMRR